MSKYVGLIGFVHNEEIEPGIYEDIVIEKKYRGDITKNYQKFAVGNTISGEVQITNQFSILGNKFAFDHVSDIRYLEWRGNRWVVDSIDIEYPRLILTVGGLYNGPQARIAEDPREYRGSD